MDFSPSGGSSAWTSPAAAQEATQAAAPAPATVASGPIDWNALAAQAHAHVQANYGATGQWFM